MNPQAMMQFAAAMGTFKNNHPKFVSFMERFFMSGMSEGTIIEISVTRPGEETVTTNMRVLQSDIDMFNSLKDMKP